MEQTLGKRIVANRKRLGLTQDQLAERLGVTAQAVSKWENDLSCPDISILPQLAQIFGISIDALLSGQESEAVHQAEVVNKEENEPEGFHVQWNDEKDPKGGWEFTWDAGRKSGVGFALLVLLVGGLLLAGSILHWDVGFWSLLWPSALLIFGLIGLVPRFPFSRVVCTIIGAYFLADSLHILPESLSGDLVFPIILVLLGISLLADAFRKPRKPRFSVVHDGKKVYAKEDGSGMNRQFSINGETFTSNVAFGEDSRTVILPRLSGGEASVSFGEGTIDLSGCDTVAEHCLINVNCSFGQLNFLVPRKYLVECAHSTTFADLEIQGKPDPDPQGIIHMDASVSFGEITIRYI